MRHWKASVLVLIGLILGACQTPSPRSPAADSLSAPIQISIKQTGRAAWLLTYRFPVDVNQIYFERENNVFRTSILHPVDPAFVMGVEGRNEYFKRADGAKFSEAAFEVKPYDKILPRDYEFTLTFADGTAAFYTGHLDVGYKKGQTPSLLYSFTPQRDSHLVFNGREYSGDATWTPGDPIRATYVYFGRTAPQVTPALTLLKDPGIPRWLRKGADSALPKIFAFYTKEFQVQPEPPPFVIANAGDLRDPKEYGISGGSAPGWIEFSITGGKWKQPARERLIKFLSVIAHEGMHQFQGRQHDDFYKVGWLMEGSADFFSDRALAKLNLMNSKEGLKADSDAINHCIEEWTKSPDVLQSPKPDNYGLVYRGGRVLHLAADAKIRKNQHPDGLVELWRALFKESEAHGGVFTPDQYFVQLETLSGDHAFSEAARLYISTLPKDPHSAVYGLLKQAGLKFTVNAKGLIQL